MKPELKLDLLKEIKARGAASRSCCTAARTTRTTRSPRRSKLGVNKINISSDIKVAYHDKMREVLADTGLREPNTIQPPCIAAMKEVAAQKIDLFDAAGKAVLY